jgi:hypothetical protein
MCRDQRNDTRELNAIPFGPLTLMICVLVTLTSVLLVFNVCTRWRQSWLDDRWTALEQRLQAAGYSAPSLRRQREPDLAAFVVYRCAKALSPDELGKDADLAEQLEFEWHVATFEVKSLLHRFWSEAATDSHRYDKQSWNRFANLIETLCIRQ